LGNLGAAGGGLLPLRSQNNSQGAADMGGHPAYLPGYQSVTDPAARIKFEAAWGTELPPLPGLSAAEMLVAAREGMLKSLFMLSGRPGLKATRRRCWTTANCSTAPGARTGAGSACRRGAAGRQLRGGHWYPTPTRSAAQMVRAGLGPPGAAGAGIPATAPFCPPADAPIDGRPGWSMKGIPEDEIAS
jgi:hypothetical protein